MAKAKLIDISGQRFVKLDPTSIGPGYGLEFYPQWEKKLVRKQMGSIENMIEEIYREKKKFKL